MVRCVHRLTLLHRLFDAFGSILWGGKKNRRSDNNVALSAETYLVYVVVEYGSALAMKTYGTAAPIAHGYRRFLYFTCVLLMVIRA